MYGHLIDNEIHLDATNIVCDFEEGYEPTGQCKSMTYSTQGGHSEPWIWKDVQTETLILQDHTYESGTTFEFSRNKQNSQNWHFCKHLMEINWT